MLNTLCAIEMRTVLSLISIVLLPLISDAQIVIGTLVDKNTGEPVIATNIIVASSGRGCVSQPDGSFSIRLDSTLTVQFSGITYPMHMIRNIDASTDTIDIGLITLVPAFTGYVTYKMKGGFFKKSVTKCEYRNDLDKYTKKDFEIKCPSGNSSYKWQRNEGMLILDYTSIKTCTQQ